MKRGNEIYSVFGQMEAVAADIMIKKYRLPKIPANEIPNAVRFGTGPYEGVEARFAVVMPRNRIPEFNRLCAELRA